MSSSLASAQIVWMSGEYGVSTGRIVNLPLNPPKTLCSTAQNARCHPGKIDFPASPTNSSVDALAEPSSGVGVSGAGVVYMNGGVAVGSPFTIPPGAFQQDVGHQFTPIVNSVGLHQLDTSLSFSMPAVARAVNPPANTRVFQANAWNVPGNGQSGRAAASTTPISGGTQTEHAITVRYKAGVNAFGGTMAAMQDGEGQLYLASFFQGTGSTYNTETRPWVGMNNIGDGIPNNPSTRYGGGWNYTRMGAQAAGVIRNMAGVAPACTVDLPPGPPGCGLVTDFTGFTIGTIPSATSTQFLYAWTTGTVEVLFTGTVGGLPAEQLLTAMGYDMTSMTTAGASVRNVGLVAGSFTRRNQMNSPTQTISRSGHQVIGVNMQLVPEPQNTAALVVGLGLLGLVAGRPRLVR